MTIASREPHSPSSGPLVVSEHGGLSSGTFAFRDCGAAVVQFGRKLRDQMIDAVIPTGNAPPALTPSLVGKAGAKWIVVGGTTADGTLLGPAGALLGLAAVPVVRAFDP
jgi:hypothetical protein